MSIFIDTSAFLALLDRDENNFPSAKTIWRDLIEEEQGLSTSNYVFLETHALIQRRLGMEFVQAFAENLVPMIEIEWIDRTIHQSGVTAMLTANRRQLSLVDCISFEVCRKLGIKDVFAFDKHFEEQGFHLLSARND